ncbi:MAG: CCP domain-containing protein [Myxococcota bacterium]|nr:CCP domain-containing protein [Myxococcota bacterium]
MRIRKNKIRIVSIAKYLALTFALVTSFVQSASAAWKPAVVSLIQLELEMESCGFLDDKDKIYTRCLQINHPVHHRWNYSRWNARGTMCKALIAEYDAAFWYRQDVANDTNLELRDNSCIGQVLDVDLESVRADAIDNAPAPEENNCVCRAGKLWGPCSTQQKNEGEGACRDFYLEIPQNGRDKSLLYAAFYKVLNAQISFKRVHSDRGELFEEYTCVNWRETGPPRTPDARGPSAGDQCMSDDVRLRLLKAEYKKGYHDGVKSVTPFNADHCGADTRLNAARTQCVSDVQPQSVSNSPIEVVNNCTELPAPTNGTTTFVANGLHSSQSFQCNDGYVVEGDAAVTCVNLPSRARDPAGRAAGANVVSFTWSQKAPTCVFDGSIPRTCNLHTGKLSGVANASAAAISTCQGLAECNRVFPYGGCGYKRNYGDDRHLQPYSDNLKKMDIAIVD